MDLIPHYPNRKDLARRIAVLHAQAIECGSAAAASKPSMSASSTADALPHAAEENRDLFPS